MIGKPMEIEPAEKTEDDSTYNIKKFSIMGFLKTKEMQAMQCTLQKGTISYKDKITVRKDQNNGDILINGVFCKEYLKIRQLLKNYLN